MGLLVEGKWLDQWYENSKDGSFKRENAQFRHWITPTGEASPTGEAGFKAEPGRYHLYVSLACPWAHRTLIFRRLKGLENIIDVSIVSWLMKENGWTFDQTRGSTGDLLGPTRFLYERYLEAKPQYTGRVTVPMLWDKKRQCIVNNESADIIRMFNSAFDTLTENRINFYPKPLQKEIDSLNELIYSTVNNGVYKAGFATEQKAYALAFEELFTTLDQLEDRLGNYRYLTGEYLTEADWRLFTTLIRFDAVYYGHFKCNLRRIMDFPNLQGWLKELYQWPDIAETVNFEHIKHHYYGSHGTINPSGIIPGGPALDLVSPHNREQFSSLGLWQENH
ncbi:glutathione-dependent reductase [Pseudomonas asuensis]|uniref:Glutathione-dependent reductase n=1 Tax=Pseudomonas asuensis TaxID=1825787 RepID=A0ABQ2H208_9PSED|nr:glutathione S-transferase family protein [Pseudomonas asuensis]GGM23454.1 glutathione-dependent reductase [Pseudomonas asuensis]